MNSVIKIKISRNNITQKNRGDKGILVNGNEKKNVENSGENSVRNIEETDTKKIRKVWIFNQEIQERRVFNSKY